MTKQLARIFVLALINLTSLHSLAAASVFEVSDGKSRILIGGTIHLLRASDFPLPVEFDLAYAEASGVYFETDIAAAMDPQFGMQLAQVMAYPAGKSLNTELNPEVWKKLQHYAESSQFPLEQFIGFTPAFVSIMLTVTEAQRRGYGEGIDQHYYQRAKTDNKATGELESKEDVLAFMQGLTKKDGNQMIESTLRDLSKLDQMFDDLLGAWRKGDMAALHTQLGKPMKKEAPELYNTLLTQRNRQWLPKIEALFKQEGTELVLVGSLHLAGSESVLEMLKSKGYSIKPYQKKD